MTMRSHQHFEELVSASLTGDLSDAERLELDAHLDRCEQCTATLAAFADQRRIVAGVRHVPPPRDLGARVRAGIEGGAFAEVPWWRRPVAVLGLGGGLAAVAGGLLALAILNATPDDQQVGVGSASPVPVVSQSLEATPSTAPSAAATAAASPAAPVAPSEPPQLAPEPDVYLAYTGPFDNLLLTLRDGTTGQTLQELPAPGPAVAAELSPNGQFLAYITTVGESGLNELWVTHLPRRDEVVSSDAVPLDTPLDEGETVSLGQSVAGGEFLERLTWSPNSWFVSFTVATTDGTRASFFDVATSRAQTWTDGGNTYNAGWLAAGDRGQELWALVSVAGTEPATYVYPFGAMSRQPGLSLPGWPFDPADSALPVIPGVFQPHVSPDGAHVIFWRGVMDRAGDEWVFVEGGAPYIAELVLTDQGVDLANERPLFSDVTIDRDAFTSAGVAWGVDGDAYAVWGAQWTGIPQASGEYPDINRVYFGHASDDRELTEFHAIDAADLPEGASVVDVKVPTGRHLLVTAQMPIGGVMEAPRAHLILVTRNTGEVADEVQYFSGPGSDTGWFGPAAIDGLLETTAE